MFPSFTIQNTCIIMAKLNNSGKEKTYYIEDEQLNIF